MKTESQICRLCFNACDIFEIIAEATKETLNKLRLEIDLFKTDCPVMCGKCSATIRKWFDFKATCLRAQSYVNGEHCIDEACSNKQGDVNRYICYLCMKIMAPSDYFVSLSADEKSLTSVKIVLFKYFSEIDIGRVINPVICASCLKNLDEYSTFISTCLEGENKIKKYYERNGIDSTERIDLYRVLDNKNCIPSNRIKPEQTYSTSKSITRDGLLNTDLNSGSDDKKMDIKCEHVAEPELDDHKIDIKHEALPEESLQEQTPSTLSYKCKTCAYRTTIDKSKMHKCHVCGYQTKIKSCLHRHMLTHESGSELTIYKCTECDYVTKRKDNLQRHKLTHNDSSKVMHKCPNCEYQTRFIYYLRKHIVSHKRSSEMTVEKCTECDYVTKRKNDLWRHTLTHKTISKAAAFKCPNCNYQTNIAYYLRKHMITHKSSSEVTMHKCTECKFETKYSYYLRRHMLVHRGIAEVTMHRCRECGFETKYKGNLNVHMLLHKGTDDVPVEGSEVSISTQ